LIGIRAALWQAANTYSKVGARQSEWRVNAIGQGKGKKRKEERMGEIGNQLCLQGAARDPKEKTKATIGSASPGPPL
jgi:hypothetical protein